MRWRRYLTDDGRRLVTYEVPAAVVSQIGLARVRDALAQFERGEAQRMRTHRMQQLIAQGVKPTAIAHELGITESAVRAARKKRNDQAHK